MNLKPLSQVQICVHTSSAILGQKNLSCNNPSVCSTPRCPLSSWQARITLCTNLLGKTNCTTNSGWIFKFVVRYSSPFFRIKSFLYLNRTLVDNESISWALYMPNWLDFKRCTILWISISSICSLTQSLGVNLGIVSTTIFLKIFFWNIDFRFQSWL